MSEYQLEQRIQEKENTAWLISGFTRAITGKKTKPDDFFSRKKFMAIVEGKTIKTLPYQLAKTKEERAKLLKEEVLKRLKKLEEKKNVN